MSERYGANKTIEIAGTSVTAPGLLGGRVRVMMDVYTIPSANYLLADDTVMMCKDLPVGARVLDVILASESCGGDLAVSVGDGVTAARYIPATSLVSEQMVRIATADGAEVGYVITATTKKIVVTVTTGATCTSGKKFTVVVLYTYD